MPGPHDWIAEVRETGRWDQPRFWRHPEYQEMSPWSADEHTEAFQALRAMFPPDEVKRIFAPDGGLPELAPLLIDPWRPDLSGLLALGFDAAHAHVEQYPDLVRRLRTNEYPGARLELAVLAALARAGFRYEYEPFAKESKRRAKLGESFPNPDLKVQLGLWVIADIKRMLTSARANLRHERFMLLLHGPNKERPEPLAAGFEMTPRYARIEKSGYSEARLDKLARRLRELAVLKIPEMRARGISTGTIGGGLLTLHLNHRQSSGISLDDPHDANRVVAKLDDGAGQIPGGERGLVIVQPSDSDALPWVHAAASDWLGRARREVIGVVLLADQWVQGAPHSLRMPHPIWRSNTPAKVRKDEHWRRLAIGLNWRWLRTRQARKPSQPT